ncbi:hypothetical protein ACFPU1_03955 [Thalassorhabdus alkalitolerans]|uniref:Sporulation protein Cse60 n=1 Tax=Thalassorhabdus alkalitolerans TaxID=2282697 RepID=A0ABW0YL78_9BACI|nr:MULTISPECIES: hypothetical protein [Bacillaceae]
MRFMSFQDQTNVIKVNDEDYGKAIDQFIEETKRSENTDRVTMLNINKVEDEEGVYSVHFRVYKDKNKIGH